MLIKNTLPNVRQVGKIYLKPGFNDIDNGVWESQLKAGYRRSVQNLCDTGILEIEEESKVNIAIVKDTYDVHLLKSWLETAKGPLKGAIKKQLDLILDDKKAS